MSSVVKYPLPLERLFHILISPLRFIGQIHLTDDPAKLVSKGLCDRGFYMDTGGRRLQQTAVVSGGAEAETTKL